MASTAKRLLEQLTHPGPHDVLRGDLALVGLPGVVFTPRAGLDLPAVAFGHGWLQPPGRYHGLLRHLASWGIVAAAPATHRGILPSHRLLAADLRTTLEIVTTLRLGRDGISVNPAKLGLAGHSIGGGAAVLAAARGGNQEGPRIRAVATVAPAQTMPPATAAALGITASGLHLAGEDDLLAPATGNAEAISKAWAGPVQLRIVPKMTHLGVTEGAHWSQILLQGKPQYSVQRHVRALFTAFFLAELTGDETYRELLDSDLKAARIAYENEATRTPA
ncbi:dienelactone hydrolase family protein [Saccharomonospora xinjiangensis]|uniref:Dienelactone hydrolase-like enzyme n=1 Tax=Saccharomonospora xinjiangensis XJ-54 TaxID=882086 RepID=I0V108_9PSEU|nr:dienelactone hydrolase [Saccharomonospora xinjiangensis]EID53811.1 dienelactone hydrolase-like enzyme [Saccharomonospora xinjiangensis XJ-54]